MFKKLALCSLAVMLSGCLEDQGSTSAIVIPPGSIIKLDMATANKVSDRKYSLSLLHKTDAAKNIFENTKIEMDSDDKPDLVVRVLPKSFVPKGAMVARATIAYRNNSWYSLILPDRVTKVDLISTLIYNLLSTYPGRDIGTYTAQEIEELEVEIRKIQVERMALFGLTEDYNPDFMYSFMRNALSTSVPFLNHLKKLNVNFNFDSQGNITSGINPFNVPYRAPIVDKVGYGKQFSGTSTAEENKEKEIKVTARDLDEGDQIFYAWLIDDASYLGEMNVLKWTPNFEQGRPEPYQVSVLISDGGQIIRTDGELLVANVNRRPAAEHSCNLEAVEGKEWTCILNYNDLDGEQMGVRVDPLEDSNPVYVDGQVAPVDLNGKKSVEIKWTPNNEDARKKTQVILVVINDTSGGSTFASLTIQVNGSNRPPYLVGGTSGVNPITGGASEWDFCTNAGADGIPAYEFYLDFEDPDNLGPDAAVPPDEIIVTTQGTLNPDISLLSTTATATGIRKAYQWKPRHARRAGTYIISVADNQEGRSSPVTLNLTSTDRNTKPCINSMVSGTLFPSPIFNVASSAMTASDSDGDLTHFEIFGFNDSATSPEVLRHMIDVANGQALTLRRNAAMPEATFRKGATSLNLSHFNETILASGLSGHVKLTRAEDTANRTIPKGLIFSSVLANRVMQFETLYATTVEPGEVELWVPVVARSRNAAVNTVTVIDTSLATPSTALPVNIFVTNDTIIGDRGVVRFYRNTTSASNVTLAKGTIVKTANNPSIEFQLPTDFIFPANATGTQSMNVPVWRRTLTLPANTALTMSAQPNPAVPMTATSVAGLVDWPVARMNQDSASVVRSYHRRVLDGYLVPVNQLNTFNSALPPEAATLIVRNPVAFRHEGKVNFTRTAKTTAFTLPAGTQLRTANFTRYETLEPVTMAVNQTAVSGVWVRRIDNLGVTTASIPPAGNTSRTLNVSFNDSPFISRIISDTTINAYEAAPPAAYSFTGGLVEASDNANEIPSPLLQNDSYWYPQDRTDFYRFDFSAVGAVPTSGFGAFKFCREQGAFAAACTACTLTTGIYRDYFKSNKCYIRYNPNPADLSRTFVLRAQLQEYHGHSLAVGHNTFTNITFNYIENNDVPIVTNGSYAAYGGGVGGSETNPVDLPALNEGIFSEGIESFFNIYATDENRGEELKTIQFALDSQVYDLKTSTWRNTPPGLRVEVESRDTTNPILAKVKGKVIWKPTDADSKKFAGTNGFVIKVKVMDAVTSPALQKFVYAYYRVRLNNTNQTPSIGELSSGNSFKIYADQYFRKDFYVYDNDAFIPDGGTFSTRMTLCRDLVGNPIQHPILDVPASGDPYICHASAPTWQDEITNFDPAYDKNLNVEKCAVGGALVQDLAIPKLSPVGSPEMEGSALRQRYSLEWCPQRIHIGNSSADLFVNDNGDEDRDGAALLRSVGSAPLRFNVIAPVFFVSPRVNISNVPTHYMPQTSALMASHPFRYELLVNNSQKNKLEYTLLVAPRACALANGMCIDADKGIITWNPAMSDVTPNGGVGHLVRVKVRDTVTQESDTVHFYLKVQDPLATPEQAPVINASVPAGSDILVSEKETMAFSISVSDSNANDILFYRWYVNNELRSDEGPNFSFKSTDTDGTVDPDGNGPLKVGDFVIRAEATDGNYVTTRSWNVKIRNTSLLGQVIFDLSVARPFSVPIGNPTNISWKAEVPFGLKIGNDFHDHLIFSGSYKLGFFTKHFLWDLNLINGVVSWPNAAVVNPPWNFLEDLPWQGAATTERLAVQASGASSYNIFVTSKPSRAGPFGETTEALRIPSTDLTSVQLGAGNKCIGDCPGLLYTSSNFSDDRITESLDSLYVFYVSDDRTKLFYDALSPNAPKEITGIGAGEKIAGMALNRALSRLYITTQKSAPVAHKVYIFDASKVRSALIPNKLSELVIDDGVPAHADNKPTDVVVDPVSNRVLILLSGTGGLATFVDSAGGPSAMEFKGVNELGSSADDIPGDGRRLIVRADDRLVIGTMKRSKQVFTMDLNSSAMQVNSIEDEIDSMVSYASGEILMVNRAKGRIYRAR